MATNEEMVAVFRRNFQAGEPTDTSLPVLILHTTGRKSGQARANPVLHIRDGDNYIIIASNKGRDQHPAWYLNLDANPQVEVEVAEGRFKAQAANASASEKERLWAQIVAAAPFYGDYQAGTEREIPVVVLTPVSE